MRSTRYDLVEHRNPWSLTKVSTLAEGLVRPPAGNPARVVIEHPTGCIEVIVDYSIEADNFVLKSAGLVRTARKLAAGEVYIPAHIWK